MSAAVQPVPAFGCTAFSVPGSAEVSFCGGQCASVSPPTVMSYAQLSLLEFDIGDFACAGVDPAPWLQESCVADSLSDGQ